MTTYKDREADEHYPQKMDIHEAIETLKTNYPDACYEQLREAVDMAISALQAQEVKPLDTIKTPDDKISYAIICNKFPIPQTRYATHDLAVKWAKFGQPNYGPFYIVKCTEHFEICEEVNENDQLS